MLRPHIYGLPGGSDLFARLAMWAAGIAMLVAGIWNLISAKRGGGLSGRRLAISAVLLVAALATTTLAQL